MKIYNYNMDGVFTHESDAKLDPKETAKGKEKVYRVPARATTVKPPAQKKGYVPVFDEKKKKWDMEKDLTGKEFYHKVSKAKVMADRYDFDTLGLTEKKPTGSDFESWNEDSGNWEIDLNACRKACRDNAMYSGVKILGIGMDSKTFPTDDISQNRITSALIMSDRIPDYETVWKVEGEFMVLGADKIQAIMAAMTEHLKKCFEAEANVDMTKCKTEEDVEKAYQEALESWS